MRCPDCGSENRPGAKFCAQCGNPLVSVISEEPSVSELVETVSETPTCVEEPSLAAVGASVEAPSGETSLAPGEVSLEIGSRLKDRYEIIEISESASQGDVYIAHDLQRCSQCGFDGNKVGDEYCNECGAILKPARCLIRRGPGLGELPIVDQFTLGDSTYEVILEKVEAAEAESSASLFPHGVRCRWGQRTDIGRTRQINEDCMDVRFYSAHGGPALGLFIVADGVGGQEHGEVASQLATATIWRHVRERIWEPEMSGEPVLPETMEKLVAEAVQEANRAIYELRKEQASDMGTTVTLALLRDNVAVLANVGDSRTYLWSREGLRRITIDHSLVENLVAVGDITREQVYTHPQRNLIYRSLGDQPRVEVDTFVRSLQPGDRLILCSDGLWEMVRDEGIEEMLMREADPQLACEALVDQANLAGGEDNITVIIVQIEDND